MEKSRTLSCVPVLLALLLAAPSSAQSLGSWGTRTALPSPRANGAVGIIGRNIYYAAGYNSGKPTNTLYIYNLDSKTWKTGANLPVALHHIGNAPVVDGKLYVMGGDTHGDANSPKPGGAEHTGTTWNLQYDPATDTWKKLKPLIQTTATCAIAALKGKIYVIGGVDSLGIVMAVNQEYDPATDTWRLRAPMPTRRDHPGVEVVDSLIYVCSGGVRKVNVAAFEAYSPASDTWYKLPDIPTGRSDIGFGYVNGCFYAFGGEWPGIYDTNEEYNPVTKKWRSVIKMTEPWKALATAVVGDTIYSFGGYLASGMTGRGITFVPPPNPTTALAPGNARLRADRSVYRGFIMGTAGSNGGIGGLAVRDGALGLEFAGSLDALGRRMASSARREAGILWAETIEPTGDRPRSARNP